MTYMPRPPHAASLFFTVRLAQPGGTLLVDHVDLLRDAVRVTLKRRPFQIAAWVVLPDHMHAVWTLPAADPIYSERWGAIKAQFTMAYRKRCEVAPGPELVSGELPLGPEPAPLKEPPVWRRRFQVYRIRDDAERKALVRYCWRDPVKHGLVGRAEDWELSSVHRDMRENNEKY